MPLISLLYGIHKKNEILFNIILNNHMKEEKHPKTILADKPFQNCRHRFNKHAS